jgi:hypothetical protein
MAMEAMTEARPRTKQRLLRGFIGLLHDPFTANFQASPSKQSDYFVTSRLGFSFPAFSFQLFISP